MVDKVAEMIIIGNMKRLDLARNRVSANISRGNRVSESWGVKLVLHDRSTQDGSAELLDEKDRQPSWGCNSQDKPFSARQELALRDG